MGWQADKAVRAATYITKQNAVKLLYKHHENIAKLRTKQVRLIA